MTTTAPEDVATTAPPSPPSKAQVLSRLRRVGTSIARTEAKRDALYEERLALFVAGRDLEDKATQRELAEAAGVSETVIINALKRARG